MPYETIKTEMLEKVDNLLQQYRNIFSKEEYLKIKALYLKTKKETFTSYRELKKIENLFLPFFVRVWKNFLTTDNTFTGEKFAVIITCPTTSCDKTTFYNRKFISASLITNKHMGTFNKINYGLICDIDDNILALNNADAHIVMANERDNIAQKYIYEATTSANDDLYAKNYNSSLILPTEQELYLIKENIKHNGDFIISDNKAIYSDITLDIAKTTFKATFVFSDATPEEYLEAKKIADKFNVPLKVIPRPEYFEKISINRAKQYDQHQYDLYNLETIIYIVNHLEKIKHEYSNLIINTIGEIMVIEDEHKTLKVMHYPRQQAIIIMAASDNRFFKIDYQNGEENINYTIDNEVVTQEEFAKVLSHLIPEELPPTLK